MGWRNMSSPQRMIAWSSNVDSNKIQAKRLEAD